MKNEYIRKQDALVALMDNDIDHIQAPNGKEAVQILSDIPAADVAPIIYAHWMPQKENYEFKEAWMKCSACGYPVSKWTGNTNFCPNCGAKMIHREE